MRRLFDLSFRHRRPTSFPEGLPSQLENSEQDANPGPQLSRPSLMTSQSTSAIPTTNGTSEVKPLKRKSKAKKTKMSTTVNRKLDQELFSLVDTMTANQDTFAATSKETSLRLSETTKVILEANEIIQRKDQDIAYINKKIESLIRNFDRAQALLEQAQTITSCAVVEAQNTQLRQDLKSNLSTTILDIWERVRREKVDNWTQADIDDAMRKIRQIITENDKHVHSPDLSESVSLLLFNFTSANMSDEDCKFLVQNQGGRRLFNTLRKQAGEVSRVQEHKYEYWPSPPERRARRKELRQSSAASSPKTSPTSKPKPELVPGPLEKPELENTVQKSPINERTSMLSPSFKYPEANFGGFLRDPTEKSDLHQVHQELSTQKPSTPPHEPKGNGKEVVRDPRNIKKMVENLPDDEKIDYDLVRNKVRELFNGPLPPDHPIFHQGVELRVPRNQALGDCIDQWPYMQLKASISEDDPKRRSTLESAAVTTLYSLSTMDEGFSQISQSVQDQVYDRAMPILELMCTENGWLRSSRVELGILRTAKKFGYRVERENKGSSARSYKYKLVKENSGVSKAAAKKA